MAKTTFWDIIEKTIEAVGTPLSAREIWEEAKEKGITNNFITTGRTPEATIAAYCYTDINKNGDKSLVVQTSVRPAQFFLRKMIKKGVDFEKIQELRSSETENLEEITEVKKFTERDLHPLLVTFANGDSHFKAYLSTIFHENSSKGSKGQNEWLHPDIVGVYFPFNTYASQIIQLQKQLATTSVRLFSFEIKVSLNFNNLRPSFFQAVSNSSWANEGYLVVLKMDDDPSFKDELMRLNNAFGIGVIKLNAENIFESEILLPSVVRSEIDWDTANRLATQNPTFKDLLEHMAEDCELKRIKSQYDKILTVEELTQYAKEKGIS